MASAKQQVRDLALWTSQFNALGILTLCHQTFSLDAITCVPQPADTCDI